MDDGGVVPVAELPADVVEREVGHGADQVHGDLPGQDGVPVALLAPEDGLVQVIVLADVVDDGGGGGDVLVGALEHILNGPVHRLLVRRGAQKVLVGLDLIHRALQLADVGGDVLRDVGGDLVRQVQAHHGGLVLDDGHPGLEVRGGDIHEEAPLEAGHEPVLQLGHLVGGPVGGQDDLLAGLVEGVEGVEELLLSLLTAGDELDIVHE